MEGAAVRHKGFGKIKVSQSLVSHYGGKPAGSAVHHSGPSHGHAAGGGARAPSAPSGFFRKRKR